LAVKWVKYLILNGKERVAGDFSRKYSAWSKNLGIMTFFCQVTYKFGFSDCMPKLSRRLWSNNRGWTVALGTDNRGEKNRFRNIRLV